MLVLTWPELLCTVPGSGEDSTGTHQTGETVQREGGNIPLQHRVMSCEVM